MASRDAARRRRARIVLGAVLAVCALSAGARARASAQSPDQAAPQERPAVSAAPRAEIRADAELDAGFRNLYELRFAEARARFTAWRQSRPEDVLGAAFEAAANLFEELYRKDVFTSEFFLDDDRLLGGIEGEPDAALDAAFLAAAERAERLARRRLEAERRDPRALFALTLVAGMRADHASLVRRKQLESLRYLREAQRHARELLEVAPEMADAHLAIGAANYIIGCLPAYKRVFLWFGGVRGDKELGMRQLAVTAAEGHYLRPYAKLLLALAALREKQTELARTHFAELAAEFPANPLFARELARIASAARRTEATAPAVN